MSHLLSGGKMFVIIVYDVSVKRVSKVCYYLRRTELGSKLSF